jgi:hypothetical protein
LKNLLSTKVTATITLLKNLANDLSDGIITFSPH